MRLYPRIGGEGSGDRTLVIIAFVFFRIINKLVCRRSRICLEIARFWSKLTAIEAQILGPGPGKTSGSRMHAYPSQEYMTSNNAYPAH